MRGTPRALRLFRSTRDYHRADQGHFHARRVTAPVSSPTPCACGHTREAHTHQHRHTYCSQPLDIGGFCECPAYRASTIEPVRRLLARVLAWWRRG